MTGRTTNIAASARARLLNISRAQGVDFNYLLVRFSLERILYRLANSPYADSFILKGSLLFTLWYNVQFRITGDADLLGFGASDMKTLTETFRDVARVEVPDGIIFDPASVNATEIRKAAGYAGVRVIISADLDKARCKTQIDIGFGDVVTPTPEDSVYPVLLADLPAPKLRTYPVYTVIAEKLHAIASLGIGNSRLKDYFDLSVLLERETLDAVLLASAIKATFDRRDTPVPGMPIGLTDEFAHDTSRQFLWQSFLKKNGLPQEDLPAIVARIRTGLAPALAVASAPMRQG